MDEQALGKKLRPLCDENVPIYMAPAKNLFLDELPHMPIGKVDFRALGKLEQEAQR